MNGFPVLVEDVSVEWLSGVLGGRVEAFTRSRVGTGQMAECHRLELAGEGVPDRVVLKLPAPDPGTRAMVAGAYRSEARFYGDLAATVDVRVPGCHHVSYADGGDFVLLLEDLAPRVQGDQIAGCGPEQAHDAVRNLAGLHGPRWCDETLYVSDGFARPDEEIVAGLMEILVPSVETFLADIGPRLREGDAEVLRAAAPLVAGWMTVRGERFSLLHGDYRLDNLLFPPAGGAGGSVAVDWQTLDVGLPARDLAYFLGTSLEPDVRREHERDLVAAYHAALPDAVRAAYTVEDCFDDYAFALLQVPLVTVLGQVYGSPTERGEEMFAAMTRRGCAAIRDLGTLEKVAAEQR
ncbi:MAG: phosphotransferase [Nocardioides sp.]|uniref:phosphotransferase n=1 Tax=Nocardioides sp. TaxID=35761 RepID=UPI003F0C0877